MSTIRPSTEKPDLDALRERYRQERERRAPSGADDRRYRDVEQGFA